MDTIAAIATPIGQGGIGIVRISGALAKPILGALFHTRPRIQTGAAPPPGFPSHRLQHGFVLDPHSRELIDEVLAVFMEGPHSYTGEDVAEIQCHGGPIVLRTLLDLVLGQGARVAEPGEYTQRAFLNGRLDLSQAEAVVDLITAGSRGAARVAAGQLGGSLTRQVSILMENATDTVASVEAHIEFPDDVDSALDRSALAEQLQLNVISEIERLVRSYNHGHILREGLRIVIAGRPNVGKSSLMNALLEKERAIVTPIPGTTRDLVEDTFSIKDMVIVLTDTAGIHETDDPVEGIGVKKARECLKGADLVLLVGAVDVPVDESEKRIIEAVEREKVVLVTNKVDLLKEPVERIWPDDFAGMPQLQVSALTGSGLKLLRETIFRLGENTVRADNSGTVLTNLRHKQCLETALSAFMRAVQALTACDGEDIVSLELQDGIAALKGITGESIAPDLLGVIFSRFCVGK